LANRIRILYPVKKLHFGSNHETVMSYFTEYPTWRRAAVSTENFHHVIAIPLVAPFAGKMFSSGAKSCGLSLDLK